MSLDVRSRLGTRLYEQGPLFRTPSHHVVMLHSGQPTREAVRDGVHALVRASAGARVTAVYGDEPTDLAKIMAGLEQDDRHGTPLHIVGDDPHALLGLADAVDSSPAGFLPLASVTAVDPTESQMVRLLKEASTRVGASAPVTGVLTGDRTPRPAFLVEHLARVSHMRSGDFSVDWQRLASLWDDGVLAPGRGTLRHVSLLLPPPWSYRFDAPTLPTDVVDPGEVDIGGMLAVLAKAQEYARRSPDRGLAVVNGIDFRTGTPAERNKISSSAHLVAASLGGTTLRPDELGAPRREPRPVPRVDTSWLGSWTDARPEATVGTTTVRM